MNDIPSAPPAVDSGFVALCTVAGYYRIVADPFQLARELVFDDRTAGNEDVLRAANRIGLKARVIAVRTEARLRAVPTPAIVKLKHGGYILYGGLTPSGQMRLVDPVDRTMREIPSAAVLADIEAEVVLVQRRFRGEGIDPKAFGFSWFLPSIWRYRKPLANVLLASLFVQLFALVTPLFFQAIVDKVVVHKGYSTLAVLIGGLAALGVFDVSLQFLRSYVLAHTTNRIDVELSRRLFAHLLRLPLGYFEIRAAGQTVARVRELETIRSFLTGQALFSAIDLFFAIIFIAVLAVYSWQLTLIVVASIPLYILITILIRPALRSKIKEKFNRGAESQQFLVESIVGIQTLKAAAVEPAMQAQWEEKLAAYVKTSFAASMLSAGGQNAIQYVNKLVIAGILFFGARSVMDGDLTVGGLIAFNIISGQVTQPVLRLSQLWQDLQQVQVSVERLGDILNSATEFAPSASIGSLPTPKGAIEFRNVRFRYRPGAPEVLKSISLSIRPGEVIGIVGSSGSGKSTLTKLVQRLYLPEEGQILVDRTDIAQVDPAWLRRHIGIVLQENVLFNRSIHDNIAFANPTTSRAIVMQAARMAGADEFIDKLPNGYDTIIEERGANLSGGQRQRLAIARALATNPPILIFDEATSALDYESERVIHRNMKNIVQGRTVIIIAHRLAAVRPCNRIISMADGRIVEIGTHEELVCRPGGLYAHLWALQTDQLQVESA
ncbi:type I secretion system permease/ATPase [Rhizobium calliandrae]|uniref:Type I secretion system permease/ATPase n=1 Tax=Rhizobium calliandrae TaxID=1312182 RepID=A0ABT7KPR6_9HYPH|nr:type I secretion system permease/ATPase [Rhizobium calliandrae]MDL2410619.1 type I secretion system permease/ATPase [Rhizobium calliandrae]